MQCVFCGKYVEDIEEAIEEGFYPDFWHHEINYQGPICPDCQKEHLETHPDGEFILKNGHTLPSAAEPIVVTPAQIKCLFCNKPVKGIDPFCPECKQEHFTKDEMGKEVLKPGHEIPSFPLSILNEPPILDPLQITPDIRPKFELGQIVATPDALDAITEAGQMPDFFLNKHVQGDWGEVSAEDKLANDQAIASGERILSAYKTLLNVCIWIITEAIGDDGKRAASTILRPEDH
jgi:hypothetical protein